MPLQSITPQDLHELCRNGKTVELVDVRTPVEYREIHVKGAQLVPLDRLDPRAVMAARNGTAQNPLFLICRSGSRAKEACERFVAAGFQNVFYIEGGTLGCEKSGLDMVRGKKTISLDRQMRILMGFLVLAGIGLALVIHPLFFGLSAFIGMGMIFAGITDKCPLSQLVARMPWNQVKEEKACTAQ
jgi:rhodanese-related sulfurtransferase